MWSIGIEIANAFIFGLLTPLTAICVLPLYPGYLFFLANKTGKAKARWLGLLIVLGVVTFMLFVGVIFSFVLQMSLTSVIEVISPIAFGVLAIISILLILNRDFSGVLPKVRTPSIRNPYWSALSFGFFFGAIVIPCQPLFIAALFSRIVSITQFTTSVVQFLSFGLGIGFPLLVFSFFPEAKSKKLIDWFVNHKVHINRTAGIIMLVIALYYLFLVFRVAG